MAAQKKIRIHPGEILREEFLLPFGISAHRLAISLDLPPKRISAIVNGDRAITADIAILLGRAFQTTPEFWINLQIHHDLEKAKTAVSAACMRRASMLAKSLHLT